MQYFNVPDTIIVQAPGVVPWMADSGYFEIPVHKLGIENSERRNPAMRLC